MYCLKLSTSYPAKLGPDYKHTKLCNKIIFVEKKISTGNTEQKEKLYQKIFHLMEIVFGNVLFEVKS